MDKQEKIVCAAVKVARVKSDYKGVKIVIGVDYQSIYNDGVLSYLANGQDTNIWQNGFITSKNRFVDAKEAMKIAIKSGQYPDYEFRKKVCLHEIEEANENKKHNQENIGFDGQLYVTDIEYLENRIKEYDSILERDYLKSEDLY